MTLEMTFMVSFIIAMDTLKRLFSGMNTNVSYTVELAVETFTTDEAHPAAIAGLL